MLLIAFTLFRPGFWLDMVQPPFIEHEGTRIMDLVKKTPDGELLRLRVEGPDFNNPDRIKGTTINLEMKGGASPQERLAKSGLTIVLKDGKAVLEEPMAGTPFFSLSQQFDFYADQPVVIARVYEHAQRMPKEVFYIPAAVLLGLVLMSQLARRRRQNAESPAAA